MLVSLQPLPAANDCRPTAFRQKFGLTTAAPTAAPAPDSTAQYEITPIDYPQGRITDSVTVTPNYYADGLLIRSTSPTTIFNYKVVLDSDFTPLIEGSFQGTIFRLSLQGLPATNYLLLVFSQDSPPQYFRITKTFVPAHMRGHLR